MKNTARSPRRGAQGMGTDAVKKEGRSTRLHFLGAALEDLHNLVWLNGQSLDGDRVGGFADEMELTVSNLVAKVRAQITEKNPSARLYFLRYALQGLEDLVRSAELSLLEDRVSALADEVEGTVRNLLAQVRVRIPVAPGPGYEYKDTGPDTAEAYSDLARVERSLALIGRIGKRGINPDEPAQAEVPIPFASEAEELRKLRNGELRLGGSNFGSTQSDGLNR